jgi:hypothetical protein
MKAVESVKLDKNPPSDSGTDSYNFQRISNEYYFVFIGPWVV